MTPYYQDESVCIYHSDCRELLPFLPKTDLLLTDPPYGIKAARYNKGDTRSTPMTGGRKPIQCRDYGQQDWDDEPIPSWIFDWLMERTKHQIIFGGNYYQLPPATCWLVWDKDNGESHAADCELAWTNLKKAVRRIRYRWNGMLQEPGCPKDARVHPTQKP